MADHAISRRGLMQGAAVLAAGASAAPVLAQGRADGPQAMIGSLTDAIYINANENPHGPCPAALRALSTLPALSGRYGMSFGGRLEALFAAQNGLPADHVASHPGSYVPLRAACLSLSSAERPIAYAEPTFDSGFMGPNGKPLTGVIAIPLAADYRPDVKALLAAAPKAGVYYLCNPNNPTGTSTTRAEVDWLLANKPKDAVILVDEAYIHYSDTPSCLDLVAKGADVVVLRTFSKIYGLAGLRIGMVAARPDLLARIAHYADNVIPMPAAVAAEASLLDPAVVPARKAETARIRADLYRWFAAKGVRYVPSSTNFMMVHVGKPGAEVQKAMAARKVVISGPRKNMADWVRISIGTAQEMEAFKTTFAAVMGLT